MEIKISKSNKTALVFGATGLVGSKLLEQLLLHPSYEKVIVFTRRLIKDNSPKLVQHKIDFDQLENHKHLITGDDIFLCLGTTIKKAKTKDNFYKVDFTYNFNIAKIAAMNRVSQLFLVSSVGADVHSFFFYSRVKGELEEAVQKLPFWSTHIFRPSVLLGERNENRFGEDLAKKLGRYIDLFTMNLLTKYKPVEADIVAKAMISEAQRVSRGIHFHNSEKLQKLAERVDKFLN